MSICVWRLFNNSLFVYVSLRYLYAVTSDACPNTTILYSQHEKCQKKNEDKADVVDEDVIAKCLVADVEDDCESQAMAWQWDIDSLKGWGTFKIVIGSLLLALVACCCCLICFMVISDS